MNVKILDDGRSEPLAVLPGLMCDARMFPSLQARFPHSYFPKAFYPGCDTIEAMAELALEDLPQRFALMGHSMGARVALEIWRRAPGRVARLALVDTGTHPVREGERAGRYALRRMGRESGFEALLAAWLPPMVGPAGRESPALMTALGEMVTEAGQATYERQIEALLARPSTDEILPTISCPTFVIVGEDDEWSPVDQHRAIAAAIGHGELRCIPAAGHMSPAERPQQFLDIVEEWLSYRPS